MTLSLCSTARTLTQTASRVHVTYAFLHVSCPPISRGERVFLHLPRLAATARRLMVLSELGSVQTRSRTILQRLRNLTYSGPWTAYRQTRNTISKTKPSPMSKFDIKIHHERKSGRYPATDYPAKTHFPDPQQSRHVVRAARSVSMNNSDQDAPTCQRTKTTAQSYILNNT